MRYLSVEEHRIMANTRFAERHPYMFVLIMELVVIVVYLVAGTVNHFLGRSNLWLYGMANLGLTVILAIILTAMRWWGKTGLLATGRPRDLWYYAVPLVPMLVNLIPGLQAGSLVDVLAILALTLMVGFVEEGFFRGLMLQALAPRGPWRAILVTAALFGLTHVMNLAAGKSPLEQAGQILYAFAFGFGWAALVLRKGLLWPLVVAHCLIDFASFLQTPGFIMPPVWNLVIIFGMSALFIAYGFFLMWRPAIR
jgi:uncharacterized protein